VQAGDAEKETKEIDRVIILDDGEIPVSIKSKKLPRAEEVFSEMLKGCLIFHDKGRPV